MLRSVGGDELNVTVAAARLMQPGDLAPQVRCTVHGKDHLLSTTLTLSSFVFFASFHKPNAKLALLATHSLP